MTPSDFRRAGLVFALTVVPSAARAGSEGGTDWVGDLLRFHSPGAFDYIFIAAALAAAPTAWVLYYHYRLPKAVMEMQHPSQIRWVSFGLSLAIFALLLLLAPGLPAGLLLILLLLGALLALRFGLSILIGAALLIVAIMIVGIKAAHIFN